VRLTTATTAAQVEDLPVMPPNSTAPKGWSGDVQVRADGLEMFFSSSFPSGAYCDDQVYLASRSSLSEPWGAAVEIPVLMHPHPAPAACPPKANPPNEAEVLPLLLPDYRTLVFYDESVGALLFSTRNTTVAGDLAFSAAKPTNFDANANGSMVESALSLSCDRQHVLYSYKPTDQLPPTAFIAPIASFSPLEFGAPSKVLQRAPGSLPEPISNPAFLDGPNLNLIESPDCQWLFLSDAFFVYYSQRVPCSPP
jgi:hypothetical protein